ncbi:efflux RND transporter periplasmic adaptor subunit [Roseateles saccharophilus]|uniref:RND family efflux transporter MFP subunit n=1 Tax=Roseateles saccharophilus TaxID=304 RepID=A0A4R3UQM4_ROSSA|nr:efflux RND transporter periplasmic adaptor subunit [Roseateles saccharophilus]TCU92658.1 RND family efflux transporter MFP subunit [Roseateles saccharophilus]
MKIRTRVFVVAAGAVAAVLAVAAAVTLGKAADKPAAAKPPPLVSTAPAVVRDLPIQFDAQGHLVPLQQVDVRPQATGTIRAIHFKEGEEVKAGQLMFTLDASDVAAQLSKARAAAAQVQAQLDEAQRDLARSRQLARDNFYSASVVDAAEGKVESLRAQLDAMHADIDGSRVLVDRTRVVAPMAGLTGALSVHPGSLAQQGATTPLVNVVQMDPIGVEFTLPEAELPTLLSARATGAVTVALTAPDGSTVEGRLVFINNSVDTATGTIGLKAAFPNTRRLLWPGSFAKLRVTAGVDHGALTLAPQSVLEGPDGRFVYVLDGAGARVAVKPVKLLRIQDQLAVVAGLAGGERVVTEGQQGLKDGMAVRLAK